MEKLTPSWSKRIAQDKRQELLNKAAPQVEDRHHTTTEVEDEAEDRYVDPQIMIQRRMVKRGIQDHKDTTQSAMRSLRIAEETAEIGSATLMEVQRQGRSMDKVERGLDVLEEEVDEGKSLIKYMGRCCLFQVLCCCCCDPDVDRDRTRKKRLQQRRVDDEIIQKAFSMQKQHQMRDLEEVLQNDGPDVNGIGEDDALDIAAKYRGQGSSSSTVNIPYMDVHSNGARGGKNPAVSAGMISEEEIQIIHEETVKQDKILSRIDKTMDSLKAMGVELNRELMEQDAQMETISQRAQDTQLNLGELSRKARRI